MLDGWHRRDVLLAGALGVTVAGCLGGIRDDAGDESPRGTATPTQTERIATTALDFETVYYETTGQILDGGIGGESRSDHHATVMTTEADAELFETTALDEETATFVEETSFPGEILLVAQRNLHSISHELGLTWVRIEDGTLTARVDVLHDDVFDASTNATLVARLDLDGHAIPEGGTVIFVDRDGETTVVEIA